MTLYERLGGAPAVAAVVDNFYERILIDDSLRPYFATVDMPKLKAHQRAFVAAALGATAGYGGRSMGEAHRTLHIDDSAFDRVVAHLCDALAYCGVATDDIATIGEALAPLRAEIVTTAAALPK